ncbi:MAG: hypothetical protein Q9210_002763 [Variospora velana]
MATHDASVPAQKDGNPETVEEMSEKAAETSKTGEEVKVEEKKMTENMTIITSEHFQYRFHKIKATGVTGARRDELFKANKIEYYRFSSDERKSRHFRIQFRDRMNRLKQHGAIGQYGASSTMQDTWEYNMDVLGVKLDCLFDEVQLCITFQETFQSSEKSGCPTTSWKGNAFKIEGGYTWSDVVGEAARRDVILVGGGTPVSHKTIRSCSSSVVECRKSVGCLGGWMQGGGHGPAVQEHGLGADQVLEAQVVLANGWVVTASPCQHPDLFFAIRGGGGSTYGVVISTTVKAHPTTQMTAQQLSMAPLNSSYKPEFMRAVELLHNAYPDLLDEGFSGYGSWSVQSPTPLVYNYNYTLGEDIEANFTTGFTHTLSVFNQTIKTAQSAFAPVLRQLAPYEGRSLFINITYSSFPTYATFYDALSGIESPIGSSAALGSRLLDRKALTSTQLNPTLEVLAGTPDQYTSVNLVLVGGGQVARDGADGHSGVNPAWRTAYLHNIVARGWAPGADAATRHAVYDDITKVKVQAMKDLAPDTGAYMNEVTILMNPLDAGKAIP